LIDVDGKGSFVGDQGISAQDYSSGKGCVNQGPDGLGSVLVSPNILGTLASWMVETDYCVLAYGRINCVGLMDVKKDWKIGGDSTFPWVLRLTSSGGPLFTLEGMSSVKVVKVSCHPLCLRST
jgi:hypothetical protein